MNEKEKPEILECELEASSGFGFKTRKPFVQLSHGITWSLQMSPHEARDFAYSILQAAEAAETDGFIYNFIKNKVGVEDDRIIAGILQDFRQTRAENRNEYLMDEFYDVAKETFGETPVINAQNKARLICKCGHSIRNHVAETEDCRLIGCKCPIFRAR